MYWRRRSNSTSGVLHKARNFTNAFNFSSCCNPNRKRQDILHPITCRSSGSGHQVDVVIQHSSVSLQVIALPARSIW